MNSDRSAFLIALMQGLMSNMTNCYGSENWDPDRFGPHESTLKSSLVVKLNGLLRERVAIVPMNAAAQAIHNLGRIQKSLDGLASTYDLLADKYSKTMLVKVITFRLMGYRKVKLPLNTASYWKQRAQMQSLIKSPDAINIKFPKLVLHHLALEKIGYPIELYYPPSAVVGAFVLKQYEYWKTSPGIKVQDGDYVIDAGGCWGDTALYFAHGVGEQGKVFTFEFTPENVKILERNVGLNPLLSQRIELDQRALWNLSGETINYFSNGPGTSLEQNRHDNSQQQCLQVKTISIDDFVRERKLPRIDFIKMDIEGAELNALRGAEGTIRAFRPRLAISIYHREDDLIEIPRYLNGLGLGYEFYLDHFTIYGEETVLFARPGKLTN
jgi:FkbM family methyltransferase